MSVHDKISSVVEEEVEEEVVKDAKDGENSSTVNEEDVEDAEDAEDVEDFQYFEEDVEEESSGYLYSDNELLIPAEEQGNIMGRQTLKGARNSHSNRPLARERYSGFARNATRTPQCRDRETVVVSTYATLKVHWMQEGAISNQKALSEYREEISKPDDAKLNLSVVDAVTYNLMNQRAAFASRTLSNGYLSVTEDMRSDAYARHTEYQTSANFNKGVLQEKLEDFTEPPSEVMLHIRNHNAYIMRGFKDEECWKEFDPKFRTLLNAWNDTVKDL
ncbi:hypothetical protein I350_03249 [Cryptococcus amylolentus CBS 6273]|uniref:Uncharacterized protein n=1 Tax=Cryptococcus amylolentus CBS 6273 TaxID=1296118 RepID=A0A1E3K3B4_9TREE|nr:hypothetical protein I350_03249 [Cryptococcus amylolentus CBS 6273]